VAAAGAGWGRRPALRARERFETHDSRTTRAEGQREVETEPASAPSGITRRVTYRRGQEGSKQKKGLHLLGCVCTWYANKGDHKEERREGHRRPSTSE
jgi:hypothetical protein